MFTIKPGDSVVITQDNGHGFPIGSVLIVIDYGWYHYRNGQKKEIPEYLDCLDARGRPVLIDDFDCFELVKTKGK